MMAAAGFWTLYRDIWGVLVVTWVDTIDLYQEAAKIWPICS